MAKLEKILAIAKGKLDSDEQILASVMGAYEAKLMGKDTLKNGIFIATDKRVVFYGPKMFGGYDMEIFPYSNISSIEMGKSVMGHSISLYASGNKATMKWINHGDVGGFTQEVKLRIGKKQETAPTSSTTDIADQIKKLAELRDAGILTEDEFNTKKIDLLARL